MSYQAFFEEQERNFKILWNSVKQWQIFGKLSSLITVQSLILGKTKLNKKRSTKAVYEYLILKYFA